LPLRLSDADSCSLLPVAKAATEGGAKTER
jgi:hypothetical protein